MEFYVNEEKIDIILENEKTIGDVLKAFQITCEENDAAVIKIFINDIMVTAETFDNYAAKLIEDSTKIKLEVVTKNEISVYLKNFSEILKKLAEKISDIPSKLQCGKNKEVHEAIKNLADIIEEFCRIILLASLFDKYARIEIADKPFKDFISDFSSILNDFEQAMKINDMVTIGDLAEYEICPRLKDISETLEKIK